MKIGWVSGVAEALPFFFVYRFAQRVHRVSSREETGVSFNVATRNRFVNYNGAIL